MNLIKFEKETPVGKLNIILSEVSHSWDGTIFIKTTINSETLDLHFVTDRNKDRVVQGLKICSEDTKRVFGKSFWQNIVISLSKEICTLIESEVQRQKDEREIIKKAYIDDVKAGRKNIKLFLREGDILSGYVASNDEDENILRELGLVEDVRGWGSLIDLNLTKALGSEFSYAQVEEYLVPQREAEKEKKRENEEIINHFIEEAKKLGRPVQINQYYINCTDPKEECSTDIVIQYIDGEGNTTEKISHTW